ncbi:adenylate cyclase [Pseudovibrio sp. Tun.PSC04-5.I4]|uniref:adenylate cyclase n=1 Tax=Pseudovibrio sp. Tun.PSC04-5.I4 TaxID=1798213 RepID=UPI0008867C0D|nr:adenylate cyclase [Pseudovibrio sp. Tun.PSC04-5.I4]SDQ78072.1 hypothetical protein SAMN04515695_1370 [Pseudovibrio sp. Tun.PSC04-5.I4]
MRAKKNDLTIGKDEVVAALSSILSSSNFNRSPKLTALLTFLVERKLSNKDEDLKEPVIGQQVFKLPVDFNPRENPIVRVNISRLRTLLRAYNEENENAHNVQIRMPDVGYIPTFFSTSVPLDHSGPTEERQDMPENLAVLQVEDAPLKAEDLSQIRKALEDCLQDRRQPVSWYIISAIALALFASVLSLFIHGRETVLVFSNANQAQTTTHLTSKGHEALNAPNLIDELRLAEDDLGGTVNCKDKAARDLSAK